MVAEVDKDRRRWLACGAGLALAAGVPAVAGAAGPGGVRGGPALSLPRLDYQAFALDNGLQVLLQPGGAGGMVSVQVWYRVGGKDDPEGRSGFAHLFEHLMFKGSRHLQPEQFDRLTEDVGGMNNAFTAEDVTAYQNLVPSHHLERLLWAEAERMGHLDVSDPHFQSERKVVIEEFNERVLAAPYGRLFNALPALVFQRHPYRRPVIGSVADLEAATLADVRAFHAAYYRPDNAVLIVAGDFEAGAARAAIARYFGPLTRPAGDIPRVQVAEPRWSASRQTILTAPNVPLPAAAVLWQGPDARDPDAAALTVAQALLAQGDASRLDASLVHRQRLAQQTGFYAQLLQDGGYLAAFAIAAGPRPARALVAPLRAEVERLARGPIAAEELDRVRNQLFTGVLAGWQAPWSRAESLGTAMITHGDPARVNRELAEIAAVQAADVQRALRRWCLDRPTHTVLYQQDAAASAARPSAPTSTAAGAPR
ncbi:M16 family metallopeptidase [Ideonella livida]|uniref:Insulinase family protein n=1 Tax=Ideonella livida TaxID=2707176 RepID=A0A7C9TMV9_9BURK|nr:pitrilysin family protein [Ideonella livida]NDY93504.1 insulinase family protein [Ideonella livida]